MNECYEEGMLRALLDDELEPHVRAMVAEHIEQCQRCRTIYRDLSVQHAHVTRLLAVPVRTPDPQIALARFRAARIQEEREGAVILPSAVPSYPGKSAIQSTPLQRKERMSTQTNARRNWFAGIGVLVVMLALLALPPVRAAADQLLQVFRVQTVVFVPVSPERMQQLEELNFDEETLFIAEPEIINDPAEPRTVASAEEASNAIGFTVEQPGQLPSAPTATEFSVTDRTVGQFQVNVEAARQLFTMVGVTDVTLPDALGTQPITVDVPPAVAIHYTGANYDLTLVQGRSPQVTLPDGVDLSQLGRAALRLLGMAPDQADALSQQIDWSSTLLFPFPSDLDNIRQVSINGAPGMLVAGGRYENHYQLYWQRGENFYVITAESRGSNDEFVPALIQAAESVR